MYSYSKCLIVTRFKRPTSPVGKNFFANLPELKDQQDSTRSYTVNGAKRFSHTMLIKQWAMYLATDVDDTDINGGLDRKMLRTNLIAGCLVVAAGLFYQFSLYAPSTVLFASLLKRASRLARWITRSNSILKIKTPLVS